MSFQLFNHDSISEKTVLFFFVKEAFKFEQLACQHLLLFFKAVKMREFRSDENGDLFLIYAQNIDCGYLLELPQ